MTPGPDFKSPILSPALPLTTLMTLDMLVGLAGLHNHKIKTDMQMRTKQYCPRVSLSDTDEFRREIQGPPSPAVTDSNAYRRWADDTAGGTNAMRASGSSGGGSGRRTLLSSGRVQNVGSGLPGFSHHQRTAEMSFFRKSFLSFKRWQLTQIILGTFWPKRHLRWLDLAFTQWFTNFDSNPSPSHPR